MMAEFDLDIPSPDYERTNLLRDISNAVVSFARATGLIPNLLLMSHTTYDAFCLHTQAVHEIMLDIAAPRRLAWHGMTLIACNESECASFDVAYRVPLRALI